MSGKSGAPRWLDGYLELVRGGWPWRVAAYIVWASSPKAGREPKTQDELARFHLGLTSERAISTWRKRNPAIDEVVRVSRPLDPARRGWSHHQDVTKPLNPCKWSGEGAPEDIRPACPITSRQPNHTLN